MEGERGGQERFEEATRPFRGSNSGGHGVVKDKEDGRHERSVTQSTGRRVVRKSNNFKISGIFILPFYLRVPY